MTKTRFIASAAALALATVAAHANLLDNGSFEDVGTAAWQGWGGYTFGSGYSPVLPGWTVGSGSVDVTDTPSVWGPAFDGTRSLDLNGWDAGTLSQTFATVAGQSYLLTFAYSRNPVSGGGDVGALVTAGSGSQVLDVTSAGGAYAMTWQAGGFAFVASGPTTTLTFQATTPGNGGIFLDAVSVSAVPEPATLGLLALGLAGVVGVSRRRRG